MRKSLTKKQDRIFGFVRKHVQDIGYPPTVREIGMAFSISEKGAHDHLNAIEKKGYIRRIPKEAARHRNFGICATKTTTGGSRGPDCGAGCRWRARTRL